MDHFFPVLIWILYFLIIRSITNFFEFETVTKTTVRYQSPAEFPTITICNINPFVNEAGILKLVEGNITRKNFTSQKKFNQYLRFKAFNLSLEDRKNLGLKIDELIYDCSFKGELCDFYNDFRWIYSYSNGNCFQYNSGYSSNGSRVKLKSTFFNGPVNGLRLKVYTGTSKYYSDASGLQIIIHNSSVDPLFDDVIDVATSLKTSIAIKTYFINKQERPYSDCVSDLKSINSDLVNMIINSKKTYRKIDCLFLCLNRFIIKECGCYNPGYGIWNNIKQCSSLDDAEKYSKLLSYIFESNIFNMCLSECPLECTSIEYINSISSSFFPTIAYLEELNLIKSTNFTTKLNSSNHLALNIYYNSLSYTETDEIAKTNLIELISNIGGTLGLFTGASFLSFVEIFEIIFLMVSSYFEKASKKVFNKQ